MDDFEVQSDVDFSSYDYLMEKGYFSMIVSMDEANLFKVCGKRIDMAEKAYRNKTIFKFILVYAFGFYALVRNEWATRRYPRLNRLLALYQSTRNKLRFIDMKPTSDGKAQLILLKRT